MNKILKGYWFGIKKGDNFYSPTNPNHRFKLNKKHVKKEQLSLACCTNSVFHSTIRLKNGACFASRKHNVLCIVYVGGEIVSQENDYYPLKYGSNERTIIAYVDLPKSFMKNYDRYAPGQKERLIKLVRDLLVRKYGKSAARKF